MAKFRLFRVVFIAVLLNSMQCKESQNFQLFGDERGLTETALNLSYTYGAPFARMTMKVMLSLISAFIGGNNLMEPIVNMYETASSYIFHEPAAYMSTVELIEAQGFPAETHHVTTEDGYILELHRIPHNGQKTERGQRVPVIIFNHAVIATSSSWVLNLRNQSLGFILSDAGFDVWLGNFRGNEYSKAHKKLDPKEKDFWQFSFDEMGLYDVPAMIDYVIKVTGFSKVFLMGQKVGIVPPFITLQNKPEYNDKVYGQVGMSPVWKCSQKKFLANLAKFGIDIVVNPLLSLIVKYSEHEFFSTRTVPYIISYVVGKLFPGFIPQYAMYAMNGGRVSPPDSYNATRCPVYYTHLITSFSDRLLHQFMQGVSKYQFGWYDFGKEENMKRYGQPVPSLHELDKMKVPTLIVNAPNDIIIGQSETDAILEEYPSAEVYDIKEPHWTHYSYCFSVDGKKAAFDPIIEYMNKILKN